MLPLEHPDRIDIAFDQPIPNPQSTEKMSVAAW